MNFEQFTILIIGVSLGAQFGYWLRGREVKDLEKENDYLRKQIK